MKKNQLTINTLKKGVFSNRIKLYYKFVLAIFCAWSMVSCTKDFDKTNANTNVVSDISLSKLLTTAEFGITHSQYMEWFYDNYAYIMPWSQQVVRQTGNGGDMNQIGAMGSRYSQLYTEVWPFLDQIQRNIDSLPDDQKPASQKMRAITYILQVYEAFHVSDVYGSIPYTEAMKGRYEQQFASKYDSQKDLINLWLAQLDTAVNVLSNPVKDASGKEVAQNDYSTGDYIYRNNWKKWARMANALKLRIAVRLEKADLTKAKAIFAEVKASPAGVFESIDDQCENQPASDFRGDAYDFSSNPNAGKNFMNYLKKNNDPRLRIFFEKNSFDTAAVNAFTTSGKPLPACIDLADPLFRYVGAPCSPDSNTAANNYYFNPVKIGDKSYPPLSYINRRLFNPGFKNGTGVWNEVMVSYAEVCFYIAEFVEKGYISWGSAKDWYEKGIRASITTYNTLAEKAGIRLEYVNNDAYNAVTETEINDYLAKPDIAYGTNNLEKIYLQQYINFFREPTETFALIRRTGYPKKTSTIFKWQIISSGGVEMPLPRRFVLTDPGVINRDYWQAANKEQGFTSSVTDPQLLNTQRVWWDVNSPNYGGGN